MTDNLTPETLEVVAGMLDTSEYPLVLPPGSMTLEPAGRIVRAHASAWAADRKRLEAYEAAGRWCVIHLEQIAARDYPDASREMRRFKSTRAMMDALAAGEET